MFSLGNMISEATTDCSVIIIMKQLNLFQFSRRHLAKAVFVPLPVDSRPRFHEGRLCAGMTMLPAVRRTPPKLKLSRSVGDCPRLSRDVSH